jgi:mycothiol system anti-sigma-R factor
MIFDRILGWFGWGSDRGSSPAAGDDASGCPEGSDRGDMIPCHEALARLYEYLDGELEPESREEVEAHFAVCARCYPQLATERSFRAAVQRAMDGGRAPEALRHRVLSLLDEAESGS